MLRPEFRKSQCVIHSSEFRLKNTLNFCLCSVNRMFKTKLGGMKQHAIHSKMFEKKLILFITAVWPITDDRMKDMRHMLP